jgi:hypothetical protein
MPRTSFASPIALALLVSPAMPRPAAATETRLRLVTVSERHEWDVHASGAVSSFGMDSARELSLLTLDGRVPRIAPAP